MLSTIAFTLNDQAVSLDVDDDRKLLWVLRTELGLTGTKYGCGIGQCGACTVLVDDNPVRACLLTAGAVKGKHVTTIEGLAKGDQLHPLQKAFMASDALQCGFCTPGMVLTAFGLLRSKPSPSRADIVDGMDSNYCRCGAQPRIIDAIQLAGSELNQADGDSHENA